MHIQYIPRNMQKYTVFALLCFVVVIHWLIFPYPSGLLHWHCGNLTIAPVPAKQPWWIWINTSCEFIMNDCITTTKQSTTKPCAYFLGYTVRYVYVSCIYPTCTCVTSICTGQPYETYHHSCVRNVWNIEFSIIDTQDGNKITYSYFDMKCLLCPTDHSHITLSKKLSLIGWSSRQCLSRRYHVFFKRVKSGHKRATSNEYAWRLWDETVCKRGHAWYPALLQYAITHGFA